MEMNANISMLTSSDNSSKLLERLRPFVFQSCVYLTLSMCMESDGLPYKNLYMRSFLMESL